MVAQVTEGDMVLRQFADLQPLTKGTRCRSSGYAQMCLFLSSSIAFDAYACALLRVLSEFCCIRKHRYMLPTVNTLLQGHCLAAAFSYAEHTHVRW